MTKPANNVLELVGNTPLVELKKLPGEKSAKVLAKLESFNPMSSVKDRIGLAMIDAAEREGKIKPGETTIIEPTSGNTGIGLAMVCAVKGYKLTLVMPETMTVERRRILSALGAELVLTEGAKGIPGAMEKTNELAAQDENSFVPQQFQNPANPEIHYRTTGPEIWDATGGKIDALVCGIGTGGTITGAGKFLREKNPKVQIFAVEPTGSPMLSKGEKGKHGIQGIGAGFVPDVLDTKIYDEVITVADDEAKTAARRLAKEEGILTGISSGAALHAALKAAENLGKGKTVVVLLPDTGERYLSTDLFSV
ncbi:MAG: cysteine synthase A [Planctomycetota bacterium]|jgi:cysteine synthase A